jgi:hypothetical protein
VRIQAGFISIVMAVSMVACTHRNNERVGQGARKAEQGSEKVARQLGRAGAKVSEAAGKAARKAGEQIKQASQDAHQGWVEEKQKEKAKQ